GGGGGGGGLPVGTPLPGYGTGSPLGPPGSAGSVGAGGPDNIARMVEGYFESSMLDPKDAPQRSYTELARVIREMRPEFVLSSFPPSRREELRQLPPDQMAAEIIEDTAVKWAAERLVSAPTGADAVIVEEEVIRVLLRSLQATQAAGRLANKLATIIKDYKIPKSTYDRLQDELHWIVVPPKEKIERLLQMQHLTVHEFRRLLELMTELIKQGDLDTVTKLGNHYFTIFDLSDEPEPQEVSRIPDLLRTMAGVRSEFWQGVAVRLCDVLNRWPDKTFLHQQIINALIALCRTVALYEDFELIHAVSAALERIAAAAPEAHAKCCTRALATLLTPNSVERVIELFIHNRDDRPFTRLAADLARWSGSAAIVKVFRQLEEEQSTPNRMALIRLITKIGAPALEIARQRLGDERWYVVRNACKLLGDLKDPHLLQSLAPALRHSNERVQKAAVTAILDSRDPGRAAVFSEALPHLHHQVVEDVLGELLFLKDPVCLPALERFIFRDSHGKTRLLVLAVQALAAVPDPQAERLLGAVMADDTLDPAVRRVALTALSRIPSEACEHMLREFAANAEHDPVAAECARTLAAMGR
ncbi:MAG TPA: HEAT repeat domain-containing protein, partial [Terriglobales bacterium]|nr:HEAT repeat domain-containing protein [Terriglobales bacterium]